MAEEQQQQNQDKNYPNYMSLDTKKNDIAQIVEKLISDSKEIGEKQRFGFFSIKYSNFLGDGFYSNKKIAEKDENGKLKISPKGIYTRPAHKGKHLDCYFSSDSLRVDDNFQQKLISLAECIRKEELEKVRSSKEKKFQMPFYAGLVKEYKDILFPDDMADKYKDQKRGIWAESPRKQNCDFKNHTVKIEPRGIHANFGKRNKYFSTERDLKDSDNMYNLHKALLEKQRKEELELKNSKDLSKKFKQPFKPASLNKCSTFQTNKDLYGFKQSSSVTNPKEIKCKSQEKNHIIPFKPASLIKQVNLFKLGKTITIQLYLWLSFY